MPELTKSSVGSFAGTSGLEGTMLWPFERKNSRKLERISLDFIEAFYCSAEKTRNAAVVPVKPRCCSSCVDAPVLQKPCPDRRHGPLVRRRQLLQRAPGVERREQLAILVLRPGLAGLRR